jgi:ABC-type Fe3+/spermidine/putrescine transport system ATPase subunit
VAFGLECAGSPSEEIERRVQEMLALTDLRGFEGRRVSEISGGQQQRVALARALARQPKVLMLDEPLSNLDPSLRERTRRELRRLIKRLGITTILVTHEQEEAFDLGDRVGVLREGRLEQVATPRELYESPATSFVATFVGRAAVLQGIVEAVVGERRRVRLLGQGSEAGVADWWAFGALEAGEPVDLVVRPECLVFVESAAHGAVAGRVASRRYTGPHTLFRVGLDLGVEVEVEAPADAVVAGQRVWVAPQRDRLPPRIFVRSRSVAS